MLISAHVLVKDEETTVEYSIKSILDYVDEVVVWVDPMSTDKTGEIINELVFSYPEKVKRVFFLRPEKVHNGILKFDKPVARTELLKHQKGDVVFILDGDEVYSEEAIKKIIEIIRNSGPEVMTWAWTSRYFSGKNNYAADIVMTRAMRRTPDLKFVEFVTDIFPKTEKADWIHDIPAYNEGPIHSHPKNHKIIDAWHFHFPFRSSEQFWFEKHAYNGSYPEVLPDDFDFSKLFKDEKQ